jgi:hypothetical protein
MKNTSRWVVTIAVGIAMAIIPELLFAQPDTLWSRTYGGSDDDRAHAIAQTVDGGYIVVGNTYSFGAGTSDVYLIRTDAEGDTLWTKTYGGADLDYGLSVIQTADGGFLIAGFTWSYGAGPTDAYLIKTDSDGDTLWTRVYGGYGYDGANDMVQTADGGYLIVGDTYVGFTSDIYLIRTDANGDTLWTRTYGGSSSELSWSIIETCDGGYLISAMTGSYGSGGNDVYLVKITPGGDTLWTRTYGGTEDDWTTEAIQTSDGGFLVAGGTESYGAGWIDAYLIRTDPNGDTLWTRTYGGDEGEMIHSIAQTPDGGYIMTGWTESYGAGEDGLYLVRTDPDGDTLWTNTFGGPEWDWGYGVISTPDSGLTVVGYTESYGAGGADVWLLRFETDLAGAEEETDVAVHRSTASVWPLPASSSCWLACGTTRPGKVKIALYNVAGRMVEQVYHGHREPGEHRFRMDTSTLASGIYFLRLETPDGPHTVRLTTIR